MTSVLKFQDKSSVKIVKRLTPDRLQYDAGAETIESSSPEGLEIERLQAEIQRLEDSLESAETQAKQGVIAAKKEGYDAAVADIKNDETVRLEALREGIEEAQQSLKDQLDSLESLSLLIAKSALDKFFTPADDYCENVSRLAMRQIQELREQAILAVHVSSEDFNSPEKLNMLNDNLGLKDVTLNPDANLPSGSCMINLRLGQIEISIDESHQALVKYFDDMLALKADT